MRWPTVDLMNAPASYPLGAPYPLPPPPLLPGPGQSVMEVLCGLLPKSPESGYLEASPAPQSPQEEAECLLP